MHPRLPHLRNLFLTATALLALGVARVAAGPEGGAVVGGAATITGQGSASVTINQSTQNAIINWNTFNIGVNESVRFNQPNSGSVALNRVIGGLGPSEILGHLTANGRIFLINRDGVLFGPGAVVNTAGFLASTNDIKNSDFMAGRYNFNIPGRPDASIVNHGRITATSGGFAALVAPGVRNTGTITATLGTVALASGNSFTLDMYGDKLITLAVGDSVASKVIDVSTGKALKSLVSNEGKIRANGGRVELTAAAARTVVDSVINTSGVIKANSIGHRNGMIVLSAATGGSKPAGAPTQTIKISGVLSAAGRHKGTKGGTIVVSGEDIKLAAAKIDASGRRGGGKVLIGGDWGGGNPDSSLVTNQSAKLEGFDIPNATTVSVDAATTINASATRRGDGGKVVLWSNSQTTFAGTILARGGSRGGNGGFVEVSSKGVLNYRGSTDTRAPKGAIGTLLLDPYNIFISDRETENGNISGGTFTPTGNDSILNASQLSTALQSSNIIVTTGGADSPGSQAGNITVEGGVLVSWTGDAKLTLSAYNDITIEPGAVIRNIGGGSLELRSGGNGSGTVTFVPGAFNETPGGRVDFSQNNTGAVSIFYNPTPIETGANKYENPKPFLCSGSCFDGGVLAQPSQLTAYMLVNTASDLQNINTAVTKPNAYAVSRDIDAGSITNFIPRGTGTSPLNTIFDGQGYTISNLNIASGSSPVGLFAFVGTTGTVRNLNLANVNITGTGSPTILGVVAGENRGTISNVHVLSGTVNGNQVGVIAGGLVGQNKGLIEGSSSAANVSVGDASSMSAMNIAGGLVGTNLGTITGSSASGDVSGGAFSTLGGLVGQNGLFNFGTGSIASSFATGNVSSSGINASVGGLVGVNASGSSITSNSHASGAVTSTASVVQNGQNCAGSNSCQYTSAGGLAGQNFGEISDSYAQGNVSVGSNGTGGGLVGFNSGIIDNTSASGNVTGAAGTGGINDQGGTTTLGGLVGVNQGLILDSLASGNVGSPNVANLQVGGLVGDNSGWIVASLATGTVQAGSGSIAGGLVGSHATHNFNCNGCQVGDGQMFFNLPFIFGSQASGNVSVGDASVAGGLVGAGDGIIASSSASGAVTGGGNSVLGGLIGALSFTSGLGFITDSTASGAVTSTGSNSVVGGFVGLNGGMIASSTASGAVSGTSDSYLGGFAGVNIGTIASSSASGSVTGTGNNDIIGGFVGANFGSIDSSTASGNATGATNSAVGGFAGANAQFVNFPADSVPGSSFPVGTITNSSASGTASGGPGSTVDPFIALNNPTSASNPPAFPSIIQGCSDPTCVFVSTGQLPSPSSRTPGILEPLPPFSPELRELLAAQQTQQILNLTSTLQLAALNTAPVFNTVQGGVRTPPQAQPPPPAAGRQDLPPGLTERIINIPPPDETRFRDDVVVVQVRIDAMERLRTAVAGLGGLTIEASENLAIMGSTVVKLRITDGQSVRAVIPRLAGIQVAAVVQPEYVYTLDQQSGSPAPAPAAAGTTQGDAAQYILEKLKISDVHRMVRGTNVPIAVIDSEIDAAHPDLEGVVAQRFSALGAAEKPHAHGTGMAGAIAAHQRVLGTAPASRLLAVHAFSTSAATAESTTFSILKGIDWSVKEGARIINMSFAGPKDPSLEAALKIAYERGIVLIAAAGNAGPKSPPLFPGAFLPYVIAVTATDVDDKLFTGANRGKYVSVAAPGVDILVPAPENAYQITTGTSVAAAEVSGIVALLLERNPKLTPADVRRILTQSAKRLSPGDRDDSFGSGLIDPLKALQLADPRTAATTPSPAPTPTLRQR
jgi:filamentous hemagglutinin family protein